MSSPTFKLILLKLSGEVLMGKQPYGIDLDTVSRLADCSDSVLVSPPRLLAGSSACPPSLGPVRRGVCCFVIERDLVSTQVSIPRR